MSEPADIQTPEQPKKPPFQFGLKHLMALPVVVAVFFAIATYTGGVFAILIVAALLGIAGLFFSATRRIAFVALIVLAIITLMPKVHSPAPAAPRAQCANTLKQIALAMHNYHDAWGSFPPAYIADEDGRPMHSWRVLLLPYLNKRPSTTYTTSANRGTAPTTASWLACPWRSSTVRWQTRYHRRPPATWPSSVPRRCGPAASQRISTNAPMVPPIRLRSLRSPTRAFTGWNREIFTCCRWRPLSTPRRGKESQVSIPAAPTWALPTAAFISCRRPYQRMTCRPY